MDYYIKKNKRYIPVGKTDFNGFPTDGIWLVQFKPEVKSSSCIMKIGDVKEIDLNTLAFLESNKDEAIKEFYRVNKINMTLYDKIDCIIKKLLGI